MTRRKTPILLRRGPVSGAINALTRYTYKTVRGREVLEAHEKYDVSSDFDTLMLEELMPDKDDSIIAELDGAAKGEDLTEDERKVIADFRERLIIVIERHNARLKTEVSGGVDAK